MLIVAFGVGVSVTTIVAVTEGAVVTSVMVEIVVVFGLLGQSSAMTHFRVFSSLSRPGLQTHFATQGRKHTYGSLCWHVPGQPGHIL